jgi:NADH:ubiquinone oxidoreductase subunit H
MIFFTLLFISFLISTLFLLLTVAFFTLFERKIMASFHLRLGPTKVSFVGLLQPLLDALKLFSKSKYLPLISSLKFYYLFPILSLFLSCFI